MKWKTSLIPVAAALAITLQWANRAEPQVLVDPRGEDAATSRATTETPANEGAPRDGSAVEGESTESPSAEGARAETATTEGASAESRATESSTPARARARQTLPPPEQPADEIDRQRQPPPRPRAALPTEPASEIADEAAVAAGRPYLGITFDPTVRNSPVVGAIVPDSPAEQAGLQPGDVIEAVNGETVNSIDETFAVVGRLRPGEIIDIDFSRRVSARTQAMLESAPDDAPRDAAIDSLPDRRSTSYREAGLTVAEEPMPMQRDNPEAQVGALRRYGRIQVRPNAYSGEDRSRVDARELEEWLNDRPRAPDRRFRNRPLLRWRRN